MGWRALLRSPARAGPWPPWGRGGGGGSGTRPAGRGRGSRSALGGRACGGASGAGAGCARAGRRLRPGQANVGSATATPDTTRGGASRPRGGRPPAARSRSAAGPGPVLRPATSPGATPAWASRTPSGTTAVWAEDSGAARNPSGVREATCRGGRSVPGGDPPAPTREADGCRAVAGDVYRAWGHGGAEGDISNFTTFRRPWPHHRPLCVIQQRGLQKGRNGNRGGGNRRNHDCRTMLNRIRKKMAKSGDPRATSTANLCMDS